jgi:hypothetical protein
MTKWQYGFAEYKPAKRTLEAYNNMIDMAEAGKKTIARFLDIAGQKGWELCTSVPFENRTYGPIQDQCYGMIFKRPKSLRQPALQSEPLRETLLRTRSRARSSELVNPIARREGTTGRPSNTKRMGMLFLCPTPPDWAFSDFARNLFF